MNKKSLYLIAIILFFSSTCLAQPPREIGGIVLGDNIEKYKDRLDMSSDLPLRYNESLHEVEVKDTKWFKSGLIVYGTCANPGQIIRIKLKYADSTKGFYEKLLQRFKDRFGKPSEWRGDPFHIMLAWKWSFRDDQGNRISLHLQHNTRDAEEKIGNAVKITLGNALEEERKCFNEKMARLSGEKQKQTPETIPMDWDILIPR